MNSKQTLRSLMLAPFIMTSALGAFSNPFNQENDPSNLRKITASAVVGCSLIGFGIANYARQAHLNSPERIKKSHQNALYVYRKNGQADLVYQYEEFDALVNMNQSLLISDIRRLEGKESTPSLSELKKDLLELNDFVYRMNIYLQEKSLKMSTEQAKRMYNDCFILLSSTLTHDEKLSYLKKIILRSNDSVFPYTTFESDLSSAMRDLNRKFSALKNRPTNALLLGDAQVMIENLETIRSYVLMLPEFRQEQRDLYEAHQREQIEKYKRELAERDLTIKYLHELREPNPAVVIINH